MNITKQPPEVLCKNKFSEKFRKIHRKAPASEFFLIKFQALGLHLEAQAQVFSCEFCKIAMSTFLQNSSGRLLLNIFLAIKISQVTMKLVKFLDELNYILHN